MATAPDSSHVIPPTRGTGSQQDAGAVALTEVEITEVWYGMPGQPGGWLKNFGYFQFARAIEEKLACRGRAQGGNTSDKSSELIGTAPTAGTGKDAELLDWLEQRITETGSVWILPSGPDMRFVQIRHAGHTTNYPTVGGTVREAIGAAIGAHTKAGAPT